MTYEGFIARFEKVSKTARGVMVRCPAHEDGSASLSIGRSGDGGVLLKCFAGCEAAAVVASMGLEMKDLFSEPLKQSEGCWEAALPSKQRGGGKAAQGGPSENGIMTEENEVPAVKSEIETTYSYTDALGKELFQAVRLKPKSFRQRHQKNGQWVWNMEGVERVLYRLPEVIGSDVVWIVEGEKDVDNLRALGFVATCNVGGAGKWLDGYTASLADKEVVLCGDNDEPGRKHVELVFESVSAKARSVRIVKLPTTSKDVSDFISAQFSLDLAKDALMILQTAATPHISGVRMPVYSMGDIEEMYARQVAQSASVCLNLGRWLPTLGFKLRPIIPGEIVLLIGDTGTGKTALLQNMAMNCNLKTLMFELELPPELLFERFFAIRADVACSEVEKEYRTNGSFEKGAVLKQFPNIFICPESRLTIEQLEALIIRSELKIGEKPALVLIDYVQLLQGTGNRYEKTSNIAEGLKVIAKTTRTIIVVASQVSRASSEDEIGLHSGKDSGSLENSAGLVLGAWRAEDDPSLLMIKILKSTKGGAGTVVPCNFDGEKMRIWERSKVNGIETADFPTI